MKAIAKIGFTLSIIFLLFGLYLTFSVAPAAERAQAQRDLRYDSIFNPEGIFMSEEEDTKLFKTYRLKTQYGMYLFFGSMLPLLLCLIASFKKEKLALIGLVFSLAAFFIGAAYGTHMF